MSDPTTKDVDAPPVYAGNTMDYSLPANLYGQEYQWETLDLGLDGYSRRLAADSRAGVAIAVQCAGIKARDIAKCDMMLWRKKQRQWVEVAPKQHWLAKLLSRRPNEYHSWIDFWRMVITHLELAQNAYILKNVTRRGEVLELIPWMPAKVRPRVTTDGELFYEVAGTTEFEQARLRRSQIILPASQVIHLRGRMWDGLGGLSNAVLGTPVFDIISAITRYQTNLFGSDGRQPMVFETDAVFQGEASEAAFRRLKMQLAEATRKMRATGDPILLEAGLKAKPVATNSKDSEVSTAFNQQVLAICRLMEVPPHKIYHYESIKYDNQAAADNQYANDCLVPIAKNIEEKFRNELLGEDEQDDLWPEFDRQAMVAGDAKTLSDVLDKAVKSGGITINEYRALLPLGLNPIEGGDVRYVPVNMAIVDSEGNVIQQAATGQPGNDGQTEKPPEPERSLRLVSGN
jgi:HK97 family phage portal protein